MKTFEPQSTMISLEVPYVLFSKVSYILSSRVPRTSQQVCKSFSEQDVSYIQNLSDTRKMELVVETTYHMFRGASLMTLDVAGWGEMLVLGDLPKENEQWKNKCEVVICERIVLQENMLKLQA